MTGAEVVAIISVSAGALTTLLSTCFHSRCTTINTPCIKCERKVLDEEDEKPKNSSAKPTTTPVEIPATQQPQNIDVVTPKIVNHL